METGKMTKTEYFYVYAVINFEQRLAYIGSRGSTKTPLEDSYMGSYDKKSGFIPQKKLVLSEHGSRKEAFEAEKEWQIKFNVAESPLFVNKGIVNALGFSSYGRRLNEEQRRKFREALQVNAKPITLQNPETLEVFEFSSITKAAEFLNCPITSVSNVVRGVSKSVRGYVIPGTDPATVGFAALSKSVTLKCMETGQILKFKSIKEAAEFAKCDRSGISKLIAGEILSSGRCTLPDSDTNKVGKRFHCKKVRIKNKETEEVFEFHSQTEAAKFLGCWKTGVSKLVKKKIKQLKGYVLAPEPDSTDSQ
jgi:hypothetical protein